MHSVIRTEALHTEPANIRQNDSWVMQSGLFKNSTIQKIRKLGSGIRFLYRMQQRKKWESNDKVASSSDRPIDLGPSESSSPNTLRDQASWALNCEGSRSRRRLQREISTARATFAATNTARSSWHIWRYEINVSFFFLLACFSYYIVKGENKITH